MKLGFNCTAVLVVSNILGVPLYAQLPMFTSPNQGVVLNGMPIGSTDVDSVSVVFGGVSTIRTLTGTVTGTSNPISVEGYLYDGVFGIDQGTGDAMDLVLEWGAVEDMSIDLTNYGDSFAFTHWLNDGVTNNKVEIAVWNGGSSFTSPVMNLPNGSFGGPSTTYNYLIPFSSFIGADFTDIDRLSITIQGVRSSDVALTNFSVVPESSSVLLIGFGVSLTLFRRKRNS